MQDLETRLTQRAQIVDMQQSTKEGDLLREARAKIQSLQAEIAELKQTNELLECRASDDMYTNIEQEFHNDRGRYKIANWLAHKMIIVGADAQGVYMSRKDYLLEGKTLYLTYDGIERVLYKDLPPEAGQMTHHLCCNTPMREVHRCQNALSMQGWYCPECKKFIKSIGRERRLPIKNKEEDRWVS